MLRDSLNRGRKMKFRDFLEEELKDEEFRKIYEKDKIMYDIISQTIAERNKQNKNRINVNFQY